MRTRRGIERITKQQLQRQITDTQSGMATHENGCGICHKAGADVYAKCFTWWAMARQLHRANRAMRKYKMPETAEMDTLPGMDDL